MPSQRVVQLAADLIRAPSPSGSESPAVDVLVAAMRDLGFDEVYRDEAGNAIGKLLRGAGPVVLLTGHLDTVPVGDEQLWPYPPLAGEVADGALWGRGACDMKSALACMVYAAADAAAVGFSGTLVVAGVVQEEVGGLGSRHLGATLPCDVVVLGEPSKLQLKLGHRGRVEVEVEVPGAIAHAAKPKLGENALHNAARFLSALESIELPAGGPLGASNATATRLVNYPLDSTNVVPGAAVISIDYRNIPGDEPSAVMQRLKALTDDERVKFSFPHEDAVSENGAVTASYDLIAPAYLAPSDHPAVAVARTVLRRVVGEHDLAFEEGYWWFCTDAPHLATPERPVIGFGPGAEELAHTTRECVPLADLVIARHAYRELALAYLEP
ncbi:MAG TPA: M20/M25/M40 family metallo-hydrolase [Trueperaceae bacterium]|nr:M20/M25/M40 family metallo-hydrolase [Trueperaceae bacterium]